MLVSSSSFSSESANLLTHPSEITEFEFVLGNLILNLLLNKKSENILESGNISTTENNCQVDLHNLNKTAQEILHRPNFEMKDLEFVAIFYGNSLYLVRYLDITDKLI